jgi:hypothetical protein
MDKASESYKRFTDIISEEIDFYLLELKSNDDEIIRLKQKELLVTYYKQLKQRISLFLDDRMNEISSLLESEKYKTIETLKNARICKNFISIEPNIFSICYRAYEGEKISNILENNEVLKSE